MNRRTFLKTSIIAIISLTTLTNSSISKRIDVARIAEVLSKIAPASGGLINLSNCLENSLLNHHSFETVILRNLSRLK